MQGQARVLGSEEQVRDLFFFGFMIVPVFEHQREFIILKVGLYEGLAIGVLLTQHCGQHILATLAKFCIGLSVTSGLLLCSGVLTPTIVLTHNKSSLVQ